MAAINRSTDMTTGSIWKRMVSFAVPVFLGNLCQQLYNTVDSVIVGKFVGKQALAAVASSGNLIFMMTGFFMGLFIGAGIVIAQYFGAKNYEKVRAAVHTDFAFALCCGVLLTLLGVFFTPTILTWMRTPADVLDTSILYFRLYFLGSLATILYNAGMGILQAVGDSRSPLYYLVISSAVNVALDLLFVGAMDMGVAGAAVATVISQVVSAVLCIIKLTRSDGPYRLEIKRIGFDLPLLKKIPGCSLRRAELHHRHRQRGGAVQHQHLRLRRHGGLRLVFQGGGLRVPTHHRLRHGSDHLHRPESGSGAV